MRAKATHAVVTVYFKPRDGMRHPHPFPIDMLRRDNCTPHTEADAGLIAQTQRHEVENAGDLVIAVDHFYPAPGYPRITHGRWESFGWVALAPVEVYALAGYPCDPATFYAHTRA